MAARKTSRRPENHWIVDEAQIRALASSVRQDIVDRLCQNGPMSVAEIADALSVRPSALYRHLDILLEAGLVVLAGERVANRRVEKLYNSCARRLRLERAFGDETNSELLSDVLAAFSRQLERDVQRAIESGDATASGPTRNLSFGRVIGSPSPEDLQRINQKLSEISEILHASTNKKNKLVSFGWGLAPIARQHTQNT